MLPADTCWGRKWLFYAPKPQLAKEPVYLPSKQKDVIEDLTSITLPLGLTSCILIHQKEKKKKRQFLREIQCHLQFHDQKHIKPSPKARERAGVLMMIIQTCTSFSPY